MSDYTLDEILVIYKDELKKYPDSATTYHNIGMIYYKKKEYLKTIEYYSKSIELMPNFAPFYFARSDVYFSIGEYRKAKKDCEEGLKLEPNNQEAQELLEDIISTMKAVAQNYIMIGLRNLPQKGIFRKKPGNIDLVIKNWEKALEFDPNNKELKHDLADMYYNRGIEYYNNGDTKNMFEVCNRAFQINPDGPNIINNYNAACEILSKEYNIKSREDEEKGDYTNAIINITESINYQELIENKYRNDDFKNILVGSYIHRISLCVPKKEYEKAVCDLILLKKKHEYDALIDSLIVGINTVLVERNEHKIFIGCLKNVLQNESNDEEIYIFINDIIGKIQKMVSDIENK